jgi:nucleotide-binding universal stress UspA family protein
MSDIALQHATNFAKACDAEVIILTIVQSMNLPSLAFMSTSDAAKVREAVKESIIAVKKERSVMLEKKSNMLAKEGIKTSKMLSVAHDPANEIIKVAKNKNVDLVVIGSRSRKGIARLGALGSVARKVSEQVQCPVLIAHV